MYARPRHPHPGVNLDETKHLVAAEAEAAYIAGSTNILRTADQALDGSKTSIRSYGGTALVGIVHRSWATGTWAEAQGKQREDSAKRTSEAYLGKASERGHTLVPLRMYFKEGKAKVELAVGKGKQAHDKRESMKKADAKRDIDRAMAAKRKR